MSPFKFLHELDEATRTRSRRLLDCIRPCVPLAPDLQWCDACSSDSRMTSTLDQQCFAVPVSCSDGAIPTWCLIELQGELELQEDTASPTFPVGTLCQSSFVSITDVAKLKAKSHCQQFGAAEG